MLHRTALPNSPFHPTIMAAYADESDNLTLKHIHYKLDSDMQILMKKKIQIGEKKYRFNVWLVRDGKLLVRSQGTAGKHIVEG